MPTKPSLTTAAKVQVAGLVAGPIGIGIQIATGVDSFPLIPPGVVLMLTGAIVVALVPWRWSPVVGPFVGITVQLAGVLIAVLAGVIAVLHAARTPRKAESHS